jgi:hypothetical protein
MSKEDVTKWGRFTKKPKDDMGDNIDKLFLRKQKND